MNAEQNKCTIRRLFEDAWNQKNLDLLHDLLVPDYAERESNWAELIFAAFPDTHFTVEDMLAEGDRVATRIVWRATHKGVFEGIAPTGTAVAIPGAFIHRMGQDGKAIESWGFGGSFSFSDHIKAAITAD